MAKKTLVNTLIFVALAMPGMGATFFNGSFESPGGSGTAYFGDFGDDWVTGWIHAGGTGVSEFYTGTGEWGIAAYDGTNYVGFGASGVMGGSLSQTFDTVAGVTYAISYFLTTQEFAGAPPAPVQIALVEALDALNGDAQIAFVSNSFNPTNGDWIAGQTLTFVALSASTTLRFTEQSTESNTVDNGVNWALDAVTVTAVPEPGAYSLLGLGLGILALLRKQRQAR